MRPRPVKKVRDARSLITRVFLTLSLFSKVKSISRCPKRFLRSRTKVPNTGIILREVSNSFWLDSNLIARNSRILNLENFSKDLFWMLNHVVLGFIRNFKSLKSVEIKFESNHYQRKPFTMAFLPDLNSYFWISSWRGFVVTGLDFECAFCLRHKLKNSWSVIHNDLFGWMLFWITPWVRALTLVQIGRSNSSRTFQSSPTRAGNTEHVLSFIGDPFLLIFGQYLALVFQVQFSFAQIQNLKNEEYSLFPNLKIKIDEIGTLFICRRYKRWREV